jgi:hypothetical protein
MRNTILPPSVLAALLSACATESVILNSDRIEQRFGSYGIEVLASEAGLRRSNLFSYEGDTATCRTYAVVQFVEPLDDSFGAAHEKVLAGESIGATFRDGGWDIQKRTLHIGRVRLPDQPTEVGTLMRLSGSRELALHVYQLVLVRGDMELEYATILEAHHPDYLTTRDLETIFSTNGDVSLGAGELARLEALILN